MAGQLLDRQARLLKYLTSGAAIFRDKRDIPLDPSLHGIDRGMLDLEARFSHEKRMEKIAAVFPATFELLGTGREAITREFADACPPLEISRIENARQFHDFLAARWEQEPPAPPYLADIAALEFAYAKVRVQSDLGSPLEMLPAGAPRPAIRRSRGVELLRTAFDVRAIFDGDSGHDPANRETRLAIVVNSSEPEIFELNADVFDLLAALDNWTAFGDLSGTDELIAELTNAGLLELRR